MVNAYRQLAAQCDYPLHLGVTEAGPGLPGHDQVGRRLRRAARRGHRRHDPRLAVARRRSRRSRSASRSWSRSNLRQRGLEIVSCPSCGRAQVDVYTLADEVTAGLEGMDVPLRVAVMGCVVNGPGEAREADLGVASGNGKGQIFVKGEVIKTVPESKIVETLIEEAMRIAERDGEDGVPSGEPRSAGPDAVSVSADVARTADAGRREAGGAAHVVAARPRPPATCEAAARARSTATRSRTSSSPPGVEHRRASTPGASAARCGATSSTAGSTSLCYAGANLVPSRPARTPCAPSPTAPAAQGRRCSSIVGPADAVAPAVGAARARAGARPATSGRSQPLMVTGEPLAASPPTRSSAGSARTRSTLLMPACVAMFTEEVGVSPLAGDGGALYRARVAETGRRPGARSPASRTAGSSSRPRSAPPRPRPARSRASGSPPSSAARDSSAAGMAAVVDHALARRRARGQPLRQRLQHRGARRVPPGRLPRGRHVHERAVLSGAGCRPERSCTRAPRPRERRPARRRSTTGHAVRGGRRRRCIGPTASPRSRRERRCTRARRAGRWPSRPTRRAAGRLAAADIVAVRRDRPAPAATRRLGASAPSDGELVGFVYGMPNDRTGHWWSTVVEPYLRRAAALDDWLDDSFVITELHVHPDYQGRGIGRALITDASRTRRRTAARSSRAIDIESPARGLYRALGYTDLPAGSSSDHAPAVRGHGRPAAAAAGGRPPLRRLTGGAARAILGRTSVSHPYRRGEPCALAHVDAVPCAPCARTRRTPRSPATGCSSAPATSAAPPPASTPGCRSASRCCATSSASSARRWTRSAPRRCYFPALLPREPYEATGRWTEYGDQPVPAQGPQGRRLPARADARGDVHPAGEGPVLVVQGPAAHRSTRSRRSTATRRAPAPASCAGASS